MRLPPPNRIAVYLTSIAGLLGALSVPIANLDISSTIGIASGLAAISTVAYKWLDGWQWYEHMKVPDPIVDKVADPDPQQPGIVDLIQPTIDTMAAMDAIQTGPRQYPYTDNMSTSEHTRSPAAGSNPGDVIVP